MAELLTLGFPSSERQYWDRGLERLKARPAVEGCPRFGYLLEADDAIVGVILLIFNEPPGRPAQCNVSSWYVQPEFRGYATLLISMALKLKQVTYLNISASRHTWPILEAQGYQRYSQGQLIALPWLSLGRAGVRRARCFDGARADRALPEFDLITDHQKAGCIVLICDTAEGPLPFVFARSRTRLAPLDLAQLIYARDTESLVRCAGALGRRLAREGMLFMTIDAEAPVPRLPGVYLKDRRPRYFKGPVRPRLNDLTYTELVLFGA
ncbi:MAG: hypothetical protein P4L64_09535 [Caulobacteraceae bacterium]|nr:hypothetical protein [Caulobacteraceae bacterium]